MSLSYWIDKKDKKSQKQYDVCIIGGGITGLSIAYWLNKEDPSLKLCLLEKNQLGAGATGRNAGFITCGSVEHFNRMVSKHGMEQALEIWRFAEENMELLNNEIIASEGERISFRQRGAFSLAASESELKELESVAQIMQKNKIPVESLHKNQVKERLGAEGFAGGIKYLKDGEVDPISLIGLIGEKIACDIFENNEVSHVEELSDGTRKVVASQIEVQTTLVIYALNGYSVSLDSFFADKIFPTRGQIMMLEPVKPFMEGPCYANFYLDYFRQLPSGSLLIGGFRQLESDTEKGFSDHTTDTIQKALHDFVEKHLPQFKGSKVSHRWSGVMGFSVDGEPMIGSLPTDNQIFFCGGFTGHGIGLSFHAAKKLVDLIFDRPVPSWLSSRRF